MHSLDWPKLQFQFGHIDKLNFWLDQIQSQSSHEFRLLKKARQDRTFKLQVIGIFSGIASLIGYIPLNRACSSLAQADESNFHQQIDEIEKCYIELLTQIGEYQKTGQ
ncbi:MAG: hypothetical protein CENE_01775 [Candidatus Celerinatantimonas neptuna]|nr:MAG: hypothetical protein CENE_01775 [Candidatus Celerinatantimonas neptuna]